MTGKNRIMIHGVPRDFVKAKKWYRLAANPIFLSSSNLLGSVVERLRYCEV
jgi:hypothetical protein